MKMQNKDRAEIPGLGRRRGRGAAKEKPVENSYRVDVIFDVQDTQTRNGSRRLPKTTMATIGRLLDSAPARISQQ